MANTGYTSTIDMQLPSLWDAGTILSLQLKDGTTFEAVLRDLNAALAVLNQNILREHPYNLLVSVSDEPTVEYASGSVFEPQEATEYGRPDPKRGKITGHQIPLKRWTIALGWTLQALEEARRVKIDADVNSAIGSARDFVHKKLLERLFKKEAENVGAGGKSVGFADGGATDPDYVPPPVDGKQFTASHNHYIGSTTGITASLVNTAVGHLREHGHKPPFLIIASETDVSTWTGLTIFKAPEWPGIVYRNETRAQPEAAQLGIGYVETDYGIAVVWTTARVPSGYFAVVKGYGALDQRNPLRFVYDPAIGFGWHIRPGLWANAPEYLAVLANKFGIGVADRVGGVCVDANNATYTTPTIS